MQSTIAAKLGIEYPLIQGGMAWIANANLASAVSNAGGLGIIAAANAPSDWVRSEIKKARTLTDKPFGVNIMLMSPFASEIAKVVEEENVKVVTTGAGSPSAYIESWIDHDIKVIPVIASATIGMRMEKMGACAVVAEGCEAGGHIGELTTMALVPQVVDSVGIPVFAAGGIADGRGVAAAFCLGAQGVQIGTRFLLANECDIHENFKKMVKDAKDTGTQVCGRTTGHPVRALRSRLTKLLLDMEKKGTSSEEFELAAAGGLRKAVIDGDLEAGSFMAGQIAGLVNEELPVAKIIEELFGDAKKLIAEGLIK